ncbi:Aspartic proteinase nepenthesin-2 [Dichanthelium oligosanthes]|uniref:Aspartic proteinase nepenthesin-2 n=1 Tax=Dichanthelium oligosanthes TaxID=888268 RepID=A0A1E5WAR2_9POAL|nr:Aspartic proteinase nepenthesin-2 [Dichanthelium oligosanthes]
MAFRGGSLLVLLVLAAAAVASGESERLDLVPAAPGASMAERSRADRLRYAYITDRLASNRGGTRRAAAEVGASAVSLPVSSGAYAGTGQYFVKFLVGTPANEFALVADTGSDLTWVKCHGTGAGGASPPGRVFRPADSMSWVPIPCSSDTCKLDVPFSLANCSAPASPCPYDYRYKEGSAGARGVVGTDTATISLPGGKMAQLQDVVVSCSSTHGGQSFQAADGVLSLGNSKISFASRAAARFGGSFSYCLVDHLAPRDATGYLAFGPGPIVPKNRTPAAQTPLLLDPKMPFYGVKVEAIHVAGKALDIPAAVWDAAKNGGAILDSGTTLTVLATPAYKAVVAALTTHLAGVPTVAFPPFEHCYNWTARRPGAPEIPKLAVQFAWSVRLEPPAKSYVIDVKPGVKCIGVQEGEWPGLSVIGNIMQQEHLWEFDLKNQVVRFKQSTCTR